MSFEWFMALRLLRSGRTQSLLILGGVAVGVGVIVFLSALITGLQASLIEQTLGSQAHVVIRAPEDVARALPEPEGTAVAMRVEKAPQRTQAIVQWQQVLSVVEATEGVVAAAPTVNGSAFATRGSATKAVSLRGVDAERYDRVIHVAGKIREGRFHTSGTDAVIGAELAKDLGLTVGDKLRLTAENGRTEVFTVEGVFDLGNKDVNQRWVFVALRAGQSLLGLQGAASTIELRVADVFQAAPIAAQLAGRTELQADSWTKLNKQLLVALRSQSSSSYTIQFFVVVAVALGIASVLIVSVVQKSREIGILKAVGTPTRTIRRIFLIQGGIVGLVGSAGGAGLGTVLALLFASLAKNPDGSPTFPVSLTPGLFASASAIAILTGLIAAAAPATRAAKLDPAEVIRNG